MTQLFNRWLPALTFAAWGTVSLFFGSNSNYLAGPFALYAQVAGAVLLAVAVVLALTRPDAACCAEAACGHGLSRSLAGRISTFAIIALPLALMPFGSKAALEDILKTNRKEKIVIASADDLLKRRQSLASQRPAVEPATSAALPGAVTPPPPLPLPGKDGTQPPAPVAQSANAAAEQSFAQYFSRSADGNIIAEVLDLLYAAQDNVLLKDFSGKRVEMIVQYMANSANKPGEPIRFKGVRMFMQCCTADARPVATLVEVEKLPDLPEMTWVKITGIATFPIERGQRISVLKAEKVEKTEPPPETMLQ